MTRRGINVNLSQKVYTRLYSFKQKLTRTLGFHVISPKHKAGRRSPRMGQSSGARISQIAHKKTKVQEVVNETKKGNLVNLLS